MSASEMKKEIPYKIYISEADMPKAWYNLRADMKNKPAPLVNPETLKPMTFEDLQPVFCDELIKQELDDTTPYVEIPEEIRSFYKMYRPAPLVRAYCLEEKLQTPAKIYYKFEGNNTSGSHKLNSAIAQAYYAKKQGLAGVTTETGAGQWGTALSMACAYLGLDCRVYMVKVSYEQKPFRREVMRTYGAQVTPSPSTTTEVGRKILEKHPGTGGSLGCAISEAVEAAGTLGNYRYVLGSVLNQVMLHQSVIGLETKIAMDQYGIKPDIIIGLLNGGSLHESVGVELGQDGVHAVVAETSGMVGSRNEAATQGLHLDQGADHTGIAVVVSELSAGQAGAGSGLYRDEAVVSFATELLAHEGSRRCLYRNCRYEFGRCKGYC